MLRAMSSTLQIRLAALLGLIAVILGALGAHGSLHDTVVANGRLDAWQKAVFYQFVHTLVLFILAQSGNRPWPYAFFLTGILLFSGSLYLWSVTNLPWLPHVTPFGGVALMVGWLWLVICPRASARGPKKD